MKLDDLNLSEEELDELQRELNQRKTKKEYENNIAVIEEHRKYVGKCFEQETQNGKKYIRVLSSKSSNIYRFECLVFEFPIEFKENHRLTKLLTPDNAFSTIDFEGIHVEDYPLLCNNWLGKKPGIVLKSLTEITEQEYFDKMDEYNKSLQEKIKNGDFETSRNNKSIFK